MSLAKRTRTVIDPAELRFSWYEFPEPVTYDYTNMAGETQHMTLRGATIIDWDSPRGKFRMMGSATERFDLETLEELRPAWAVHVAQQYDRAIENVE